MTSGPGFLALHSVLGAFFVIPIMYILWVGVAVSLRNAGGFLDYSIVKRRIDRVFLPVCAAAFVLIIIFVMPGMFAFFGARGPTLWHRATGVWISAFPTLGMYIVARTVAAANNARLTFKYLLFNTFMGSIPLGILGIMMSLGVSEAGVAIVLFLVFVALHALYIELSEREKK